MYWVILNRGIYGIGGTPDRYDESLDWVKNLSKEEYKKLHRKIYEKIIRLGTLDFNFDVPRITNYKFEFMNNLVAHYYSLAHVQYIDKKKIQIDKDYLQV